MISLENNTPSTRPYLIRALHEWCCDNGFSPFMAVHVDASVQVPMEFVKNGEIVLNVGVDATSALRLGNDFVEFKARFGGVVRDIVVPVDHVVAIYARENGQGMAFPYPGQRGSAAGDSGEAEQSMDAVMAMLEPAAPPGGAEPVPWLRAVTTETKDTPSDGEDGTPPESPPRGSGGRPALKRVK